MTKANTNKILSSFERDCAVSTRNNAWKAEEKLQAAILNINAALRYLQAPMVERNEELLDENLPHILNALDEARRQVRRMGSKAINDIINDAATRDSFLNYHTAHGNTRAEAEEELAERTAESGFYWVC